jgi:hypothetical protein
MQMPVTQYDLAPGEQKGFGPGELAGPVMIANLAALNPHGADGRYTVKEDGKAKNITIPIGATEHWIPSANGSLAFKNIGGCTLRISW